MFRPLFFYRKKKKHTRHTLVRGRTFTTDHVGNLQEVSGSVSRYDQDKSSLKYLQRFYYKMEPSLVSLKKNNLLYEQLRQKISACTRMMRREQYEENSLDGASQCRWILTQSILPKTFLELCADEKKDQCGDLTFKLETLHYWLKKWLCNDC